MSAPSQLVTASHSSAVDFVSKAQKTDNADELSFQAVWTGSSFLGTFSVEASNDLRSGLGNDLPHNWSAVKFVSGSTEVTSLSVSGTLLSPMFLKVVDPGAAFYRFKHTTAVNSTGSLTSVTFYQREVR